MYLTAGLQPCPPDRIVSNAACENLSTKKNVLGECFGKVGSKQINVSITDPLDLDY